jgi:predicted nucleotidyltransferase
MRPKALTAAEVRFLRYLKENDVPFLLVGMVAAIVQGARGMTEDLDLWFEDVSDPRIAAAARDAGGNWVSGFGMMPAQITGEGLDQIDLVVHMSGLEDFATEFARAEESELDGVSIRVLPLARILKSKRAANRPKDQAAIFQLEQAIVISEEPSE